MGTTEVDDNDDIDWELEEQEDEEFFRNFDENFEKDFNIEED